VLRGEASDTNFIVFGWNQTRLEPIIYRIRGTYETEYITNAGFSGRKVWRYQSSNQNP